MSETSTATPTDITPGKSGTAIEVLYVEDDPGDVLLTREALEHGKVHTNLHVVQDGVEAMESLRREGKFADAPRPDLILLDLNMPRMDGHEFLEKIKADEQFNTIPIVVLTTSDADQDIVNSYRLQASCHITKPVDLKQFSKVVRSIEEFWICVVKLPPKEI